MYLLVTFKAFDTFDDSWGAPPRHGTVESMLQQAMGPNSVIAGGTFADSAGGFFMVEVESAERLAQVLGRDFLDNCHVEINRATATEKVVAHLEHWYRTQQPGATSRAS